MSIFEFESYKIFVQKRIEALPKKGYGQLKQLAQYLNVSTTFVSQVFGASSDKSLNLEQATLVCEFFGLSELETEYFLKLVLIERAGTEKLKKVLKNEAEKIKKNALKISSRLQVTRVLADEEKAVFYSNWYVSALRLLVGIPGHQNIETLAAELQLPRKTAGEVLNFLLNTGLLVRDEKGLRVGPSRTHLEADSPFIKLHHFNWRNKAVERIAHSDLSGLHYSAPMTVGVNDIEKIKAVLLKAIADIGKIVDPAPNEELMCLNMDWFRVLPKEGT